MGPEFHENVLFDGLRRLTNQFCSGEYDFITMSDIKIYNVPIEGQIFKITFLQI